MTAGAPLLDAISAAGVRLTGPRRAVAELVAARGSHFTAADIVAEAGARRLGIGRATIFRSLDLLASLGVVERLDLPNGEHAYVGCEPKHHHHVVCSGCGRSSDFDDAAVDAVVERIARRTGYHVDSHRLELFGRCPSCASRAEAST